MLMALGLLEGVQLRCFMRKFMITGALIGFVIGGFSGLAQGAGGSEVFWRAAVSAGVLGMLMRWWWGVWRKSLHEAQMIQINRVAEAMSKLPGEVDRVSN